MARSYPINVNNVSMVGAAHARDSSKNHTLDHTRHALPVRGEASLALDTERVVVNWLFPSEEPSSEVVR